MLEQTKNCWVDKRLYLVNTDSCRLFGNISNLSFSGSKSGDFKVPYAFEV